jgi:spore cortex formation protein SpoVR/YcgB (stage V sporulation)
VLDEVFRGAPEEVRRIARSVLDVAHSVAQNPKQDPEEVARQIAVVLGIPEEQVEDFIDTVVPLAEMLADMLRREEKLITSKETESSTEKQKPSLGEM